MTVDSLKNPFGTIARRKPELKRTPTVMRMAESIHQDDQFDLSKHIVSIPPKYPRLKFF